MENSKQYMFEVLADDCNHLGLYDSLEAAIKVAEALEDDEAQVNRIPVNILSYFGESFDCVWSKDSGVVALATRRK